MYSSGPLHVYEKRLEDQLETTYSSYVPIRDVAMNNREGCLDMVMMIARHDDDDNSFCLFSLYNGIFNAKAIIVKTVEVIL